MGRTNKLVDGCYSFWQGGIFPLLNRLVPKLQESSVQCTMDRVRAATEKPRVIRENSASTIFSAAQVDGVGSECALYNPRGLQAWILICCQVETGGLRDKPGESKDYYHTCYCLSGLSVAQHSDAGKSRLGDFSSDGDLPLEKTEPLLNIVEKNVKFAEAFWNARPFVPPT